MNDNQRIDPTPEEENDKSLPSSAPQGETSSAEAPASQEHSPEEPSDPPASPAFANEGSGAHTSPPPDASQPIYRWTYADQAEHERTAHRGRSRRGILLYAAVMTGVFLVSLGLLIAVLIANNDGPTIGGGIIRPGISQEDDEAVEGVEQAKRSVVVIEVRTKNGGGTGTGIIMTSDGYIATNHHVIEDAINIHVTFYDGTVMSAETVGYSEMDDLGVIKVNARDLPAATFGDSDLCYVGQTVYAIGTPGGSDYGWTTTKGIISYKNREVKIYDDTDGTLLKKLRLLQMDANVNPGNSGGPLINAQGEVIGVVSMRLSDGFEGIGFAIPSDGAVEILEAIMKYGNADSINSSLSHKRPMLGINGVFLNSGDHYLSNDTGVQLIPEEKLDQYEEGELLHPEVSGIYVRSLSEGMDAALKLQVGDIITVADGEVLESMNHLKYIINKFYAGDTVSLTVYRNHQTIQVDIVLSAKPD